MKTKILNLKCFFFFFFFGKVEKKKFLFLSKTSFKRWQIKKLFSISLRENVFVSFNRKFVGNK
jgi:hypothetical protein